MGNNTPRAPNSLVECVLIGDVVTGTLANGAVVTAIATQIIPPGLTHTDGATPTTP